MAPDDSEPAQGLLAVQLQQLRHRLRAHLQSMTSLIGLPLRRAQDAETVQALEDLRARFSILTGELDDTGDNPVALNQFISSLARRVRELYDPGAMHALNFAIAPCVLSGWRAAMLGQIVVELMMNVYRHAVIERTGTIEVELAAVDGHATLAIIDDGPGWQAPGC